MSPRSVLFFRPTILILALFSLTSVALSHIAHAQDTPPTAPASTTTQTTEIFTDFESGTYDGWTL